MIKLVARIGLPVLGVLALAGCGSSQQQLEHVVEHGEHVLVLRQARSSSIAAQVPAAIKSKGTLTVATEAQYAPNEFIAPDGHTIIGMDADLMNALGEVMGLKVKLVNANFETIIPGLAAGRYDVGASSFTDTKEREKTVDFVDYFSAGISFYAKSSANPGVNELKDLCGKTVAVEKGTVEQEESEKQSKACTKEGKKSRHRAQLPRPERRQPRDRQRPRGDRHGRLAGRRLPDQAVRRPVQAHGQELRLRAVRPRDPEDERHDAADPRGAQGTDRKRQVQGDPRKMGDPVGCDHRTRRSTARRARRCSGVL